MAAVIPTNGLGVDAGLDIAGGNLTFTTADKGVHLGVTSATAANLMDDYEEGTFTPTLNGTGGSASGVTYTSRLGWYEKIGHNVQAHIWLNSNSMSSVPTGNLQVTNLPFTSKNTTNFYHAISVSFAANFSGTESPQGGYITANETKINITTRASSDGRSGLTEAVACSTMSGNEQIMITASYRTE